MFTPEEKEILNKYVTSTEENIFAVKGMAGMVGAAYARYSRAKGGFREVLLKEFIQEGNIDPKPSKTWDAQGAAYAYLAKKAGHDIRKIYFLHLNKHGNEPKIFEYPVDDGFFFAIFRVFKHFFHKE